VSAAAVSSSAGSNASSRNSATVLMLDAAGRIRLDYQFIEG
jgi:hypothetical protein